MPRSFALARRALPLTLALLAGCGERDAGEGDRAKGAVATQASATPAPAPAPPPAASPLDPVAAAAEAYAAGEQPLGIVEGVDEAMPPRYFDVVDCSEEFRSVDPGQANPAAEMLARRVALLRRSLRLAGYPPEMIEPPLARYAAGPAPMAEGALDRLAADLDAARDRLRPDLAPVRALGECGAAEAPVLMRTRPAGGRIWLITKFAFDLCGAQHLDPWNRDACARWTEADPDRPLQLSGNYKVQARWADGGALRADRRIDTSEAEDAETPQLITLAHP